MAIKAHTCFMHLKGYCYSIPLPQRGDDGQEMRVGAKYESVKRVKHGNTWAGELCGGHQT